MSDIDTTNQTKINDNDKLSDKLFELLKSGASETIEALSASDTQSVDKVTKDVEIKIKSKLESDEDKRLSKVDADLADRHIKVRTEVSNYKINQMQLLSKIRTSDPNTHTAPVYRYSFRRGVLLPKTHVEEVKKYNIMDPIETMGCFNNSTYLPKAIYIPSHLKSYDRFTIFNRPPRIRIRRPCTIVSCSTINISNI